MKDSNIVRDRCINNKICIYPKYVLYYKFTDNMQDADHMVFNQNAQNVDSNIPDNQRLSKGNI